MFYSVMVINDSVWKVEPRPRAGTERSYCNRQPVSVDQWLSLTGSTAQASCLQPTGHSFVLRLATPEFS